MCINETSLRNHKSVDVGPSPASRRPQVRLTEVTRQLSLTMLARTNDFLQLTADTFAFVSVSETNQSEQERKEPLPSETSSLHPVNPGG